MRNGLSGAWQGKGFYFLAATSSAVLWARRLRAARIPENRPVIPLPTRAAPKMVTAISPGTAFLFFCGIMVLQLIWVMIWVPDIQKKLGIE
ncbi:hypothetical protein HQ447_15450 [bacterium]|nr:hypothetical protein [bacterium]